MGQGGRRNKSITSSIHTNIVFHEDWVVSNKNFVYQIASTLHTGNIIGTTVLCVFEMTDQMGEHFQIDLTWGGIRTDFQISEHCKINQCLIDHLFVNSEVNNLYIEIIAREEI